MVREASAAAIAVLSGVSYDVPPRENCTIPKGRPRGRLAGVTWRPSPSVVLADEIAGIAGFAIPPDYNVFLRRLGSQPYIRAGFRSKLPATVPFAPTPRRNPRSCPST